MRFKSTRDRRTTIITTMVIALIAVASAPTITLGWPYSLLPPALLLALALLYSTTLKAIFVESDRLTVERQVGSRSYPLATIASVQTLGANDLARSIRLFGNGGLFGFQGIFRNGRLGRYSIQTNRSSNRFMITFDDGRKLVLSADSEVELVGLLNGYLAALR